MVVGVMQVEIAIGWSQSLKDKRRVVRSLRDTLHRHHMVSVSEVEDHDILNRATLGIAITGVSGGAIGATLDRVLERIRSMPECEMTHTSRQLLHGWGASFDHDCAQDIEVNGAELMHELEAELIERGEAHLGRESA
jgi:uncharacterized protein YlxP (DUF503 family)